MSVCLVIGIIRHDYDVVEGSMAYDTIWNYVSDFIRGEISRIAFWKLVNSNILHIKLYFTSKKF